MKVDAKPGTSPWVFLLGWLPAVLAGTFEASFEGTVESFQTGFRLLVILAAVVYWIYMALARPDSVPASGGWPLAVTYWYALLWAAIALVNRWAPLWAPLGCAATVVGGCLLARTRRGSSPIFLVALCLCCLGLEGGVLHGAATGYAGTLMVTSGLLAVGAGVLVSFLGHRGRQAEVRS